MKNRTRTDHKTLGRTDAVILYAFFLAAGIVISVMVPRELFREPYSTIVFSADGQLLGARIAPDGQWRFPEADSLPGRFVTCLVTFEDKRFFGHGGIDPLALARALRLNFSQRKVVSGGSTLTMQLARLARGNRDRTLWQKGIEALWAMNIEERFSKDEILAMYASHAPFGGNVVGIETAAWRYFGRSPHDLSWAESAVLAILPNSPGLMHPGRNRDALREKRDALLLRLCTAGAIDRTQYELACMEPLPDAPLPLPGHAHHLTSRIAASNPGKATVTTVNSTLQRRTQETVDRYAREYASNHIHNLAALIADARTGEVLAYAGNVTPAEDDTHGAYVDIITAPRSTGSILKPFLYAGMLSDGLILPHTLVSDVPLNINGFMPHNYNRKFYGAVPASRAVERSLNVPLVRMLSQYNTGRLMTLLRQYGMTTLRFGESHYGASLILGGAEGTLWDITGMYASMARTLDHFSEYHSRYDPADIHPLRLVREPESQRVVSPADDRLRSKAPLSAAALWFMAEAMSGVNRPEEEADWQQFRSMKRIAWKTGTSYGGKDGWAVGFTPRYVVGVWVGNASGEGRAGLTGVGNAGPVLFELFSMLPGGGWFGMPYDEMEKMAVCRDSGHKASDICEPVDSLYMPASGISTSVCPYHRLVHLSPDELWRVNSSCEQVDRMKTRSYFVLPPAQEYYYRNHHPDYETLPPWKPGCLQPRSREIELIYPEHNSVLLLPTGFSGQREKFVFRAVHSDPGASIYWYVDGDYAGMTSQVHEIALQPEPGKHTLTLADEKGNFRKINFSVK